MSAPGPAEGPLVVNLDLPIRPGRVVEMSRAGDLLAIPGVIRVDLTSHVGGVIGSRLHSSSTTGFVYGLVDQPDQVRALAREVMRRYVFRTEPVDH